MERELLNGYFDYNATTPISESVAESMLSSLWLFCNASSANSAAGKGKAIIREARLNVAHLLSCDVTQVAFTSGGSEANNWAIKSHLFKYLNSPGHVITTAIEHPSVLDTLRYLSNRFGFEISYLKPDANGAVSVDDFQAALRPNTQLVSVMYANNETGVIQPVKDIARIARAHGIALHTDCVQIVGKRDLDISAIGADYASFSAHKFYGPKGIGGLYIRDPDSLDPLIHGGGQEMGLRAGTENIMAIAGMSQAAFDCKQLLQEWDAHYRECKSWLINELKNADFEVQFNGTTDSENCMANTMNFSIKGVRGEALAAFLDNKFGIMVSIGSACSNNKEKSLSHVLKAMGYSDERIQSALRVSFGRYTTRDTINHFIAGIEQCTSKLLEIGAMN